MSLKDRIREKKGKKKGVALEVPVWGETVYVRRLTAREAIAYRDRLAAREKEEPDELKRNVETLVYTVILATVDEEGNQLFTDADGEWLADEPTEALRAIFDKLTELAALDNDSRETIRGNSPAAVGASPTASPSPAANGTLTASSTG